MAGLSMGSVQTTRIICEHPELFSEVGIFSGFLRDRIVGDEEHDGIVPKSCGQSYLKAMDDEAFNTYFHTFSVALEMRTGSFRGSWRRMKLSKQKVFGKPEKFITEDMTGMCGDRALQTSHR